ncbi:CotH kinase family protein [candidate division KSB1 bacterium]|nr:CotH kinase family protein [candidate division KSB1 bacterium]
MKLKQYHWLLFVLFILNLSPLFSSKFQLYSTPIVINEFLASNQNGLKDADGDENDWIELYNSGSTIVELSGYTISDDPLEPQKWIFPALQLAPSEYIILWASGKDTTLPGEIHANFKLGKGGEFIGLYDGVGNPIDTLTFMDQTEDVSMGRLPNGYGSFIFFSEPTPGAENQQEVHLTISPPNGVYTSNVTLIMNTDKPDGEIRYTADGTLPNETSTLFIGPVTISQTTALKAAVFSNGERVTEIESRIYLVHENLNLPVLALLMDSEDLWDPNTGIYTNPLESGDDWERPVQIVLFENDEEKFNVPAGIEIHGQTSRNHPKKRFRLSFKSKYGMSSLEYPLFPQKEYQSFKRLVVHSNLLSNTFTHHVWDQLGGLVSGFKPVVLFLNHEYWGIYWIRERVDKYYVESNLGFDDMDLNRSEWYDSALDIVEGDRVYWDQTLTFFYGSGFNQQYKYQQAITQYVERDNFTDYRIVNIFTGNYDWPQKNIDRVRDRQGNPRWKYMMWDTDATWGGDWSRPTLEWATRSEIRPDIRAEDSVNLLWSTLIIRKLLENITYKHFFINRFCDLLNSNFSYSYLRGRLNELTNLISAESVRDWEKWWESFYSNSYYMQDFESFVEVNRQYCWYRPGEMRNQLSTKFNLTGSFNITLEAPEGNGRVKLNSLDIETFPWQGEYFNHIPITIRAIPDPGYKFIRWNNPQLPQSDSIEVTFASNTNIWPIFRTTFQFDTVFASLITDSSAQIEWSLDEWGWGKVEFGINQFLPYQTEWSADSALVHQQTLTNLADDMVYYYRILARDSNGNTAVSAIDSFRTAERETSSISNQDAQIPRQFTLYPFYPNPFNPETTLRYDLPQSQKVTITVYNIHGQVVQREDWGTVHAGTHQYIWHAGHLPTGTYIFRIIAGPWRATQKCVLMK